MTQILEIEIIQNAIKIKEQGNNYFRQNKYQESLNSYDIAINLLLQDLIISENGKFFILKNNSDQSTFTSPKKYFMNQVNLKNPETFFSNRAATYLKLSNLSEAKKNCLITIEINPNFSKAWFRLALIYNLEENFLEAYYAANKALILESENKEVLDLHDKVQKKITQNGTVYIWGSGKHLVNGYNNIMIPFCIELSTKSTFCCAGFKNSAFIKEEQIFEWGEIPNSSEKLKIPSLNYPIFKSHSILSISLGKEHSAAISKEGLLFTWGKGSNGRLGHGKNEDILHPKLLETFFSRKIKIKQVTTGLAFTIILTIGRNVYSTGNNYQGQCGIGSEGNEQMKPVLIKSLKNIVQISSGFDHTLALNEEGIVYSWGRGWYGALGLNQNENTNQPFPTKITNLFSAIESNSQKKNERKDFPIFISSGGQHSMILTFQGFVYSWGRNDHGALGLGKSPKFSFSKIPQKIPIKNISFISCGSSHSLMITKTGKLYSTGKGDIFNLGGGGSLTEPQYVEGLENEFVFYASAGDSHNLILSSKENGKPFQIPWKINFKIDYSSKSLKIDQNNLKEEKPILKNKTKIRTDPLDYSRFKLENIDPELAKEEKLKKEEKEKEIQDNTLKFSMLPGVGQNYEKHKNQKEFQTFSIYPREIYDED